MSMWRKIRNYITAKDGNIGVQVENTKTGKRKILLNSHGKGSKYAAELKNGYQFSNAGQIKTDRQGEVKRLTKDQKAYRRGYLAANRDHADAYNAKNNPAAYREAKKQRAAYAMTRKNKKRGR